MSIYTEEETRFIKRLEALQEKALQNGAVTLLRFLNPREQQFVNEIIKKEFRHIGGGYDGAEYKRAIITPYEFKDSDLSIQCIKLEYNHRFLKLEHKHILGSVLALGITRDSIGDIVFIDQTPYIFCTKEISQFIINDFKTINGKPINCLLCDFPNKVVVPEYNIKKIFVSSLRLDNIIAHALNISRSVALDYITKEMVKVNFKICQNATCIIKNDDLLSIRTKGRIRIISIENTSKKGRICLSIGFLEP